jgi:Mg-chelatase subunit ChlD
MISGSRSDDPFAPLFQSSQDFLKSTRNIFQKFLRRMRRQRRFGVRQSGRRQKIRTLASGRAIRVVHYRAGDTILSPYHTFLRSVQNGNYDLKTRCFTIGESDLSGWVCHNLISLTLILAVDLSRSTFAFKGILSSILKSLREYFHRNNDRIGLIALQGSQARILNHPTRNSRVVVKNLVSMKIQGMTPLADGLMKSIDMARLERQRNPGSRSIIILLSDCFPEPITHKFSDIFDEPAYRAAQQAAAFCRFQRVTLLIVAPAGASRETRPLTPGERLALQMAKASRGRLIKLETSQNIVTNRDALVSSHEQVSQILAAIETAFQLPSSSGIRHEQKFTGR